MFIVIHFLNLQYIVYIIEYIVSQYNVAVLIYTYIFRYSEYHEWDITNNPVFSKFNYKHMLWV